MWFSIWSVLIFLFTFSAYALEECIGSKESKNAAVYLHGMDTEIPASQELENRKNLEKISKSLDNGVALPRAKNKCPNGNQICWGWNFNEDGIIDPVIKAATESTAKCFPKSKSVGLIGFSNGGFAINQILKDCRKTDFAWLVSVGAAGSSNISSKKDLSSCGSLVLMAGKKDKYNYERIKELQKWFNEHKAKTTLIEYDEGHVLPGKALEEALGAVIAK